jgi:predicted AlkP superfamily phosphohydrolase/phosphomutase
MGSRHIGTVRPATGTDRPQTLIIGLDGATFDIIDPMLRERRLPNIARLMKDGGRATLMSSTPPLSPIAWASIVTGVNPGKHGVYDFAQREPDSYEFVPNSSAKRRARAMWNILGDLGKRVCVVNVPLTYPAERVNGVMISGFPSPPNATNWTYPRTLGDDLERELHDIDFRKPVALVDDGEEGGLLEDLTRTTHNQVRVLKHLLARERYDFIMTVFDGIDAASHSLWRYLDPDHPKYDTKLAPQGRKAFYRSYELADEAIGELLGEFETKPNVIILSDHGNGPVYYGVCINNWLAEMGYLAFKRNLPTRLKRWTFRRGFNVYSMFVLAKRLGILPSLEAAYGKRSLALRVVKKIALSFADIDWARTKVYSFGNYGQLCVNVKGREPLGVVEAGAEYDELVEQIKRELLELKDPERGNVIFDRVLTKKDLYRGPYADEAPDLVFLDSKLLYNAHRFFELASNSLVTPHPIYSGNHKPEGILIASGPRFTANRGAGVVSILDVAPSVLVLDGKAPPAYMDGEPLLGMLRPLSGSGEETVLLVPKARVGEYRDTREGVDTRQFIGEVMTDAEGHLDKEFPR